MKKIAVFIANGNEETEIIATIDVLRRANLPAFLISISSEKEIITSHQIKISADFLFEEVDFSQYQMLVLPGGVQGVEIMKKHESLKQLLQQFYNEHKYIAAICAAPTILSDLNFLSDKKATCYPTFSKKMKCIQSNENVIFEKNIITAKSVAYSLELGLKIVEVLCGKEKSNEIAQQMIFNQ